jgi:Fe-S cluster assembly iron-binding protein IscA
MTAPETTTPATETPTGVVLSDPAAEKVKALLAQEGRDDLALRVAVQPGGCSACATSCSSTSARSTATPCRATPTGSSASSSTG